MKQLESQSFYRSIMQQSVLLIAAMSIIHPALEVFVYDFDPISPAISSFFGFYLVYIAFFRVTRADLSVISRNLIVLGQIMLTYRIWTTNGVAASMVGWFTIFPIYSVVFNDRKTVKWTVAGSILACLVSFYLSYAVPYRDYSTYPAVLGGLLTLYVFVATYYHMYLIYQVTDSLNESVAKERALTFHNSKLAGIGRLAGQIAHEINTPLNTLIFLSENLKQKMGEQKTPEIDSFLEKQMMIVNRISASVQTILRSVRVSGKSEKKTQYVDPATIVSDLQILLGYRLRFSGLNLNINTNFTGSDMVLKSDTSILTQALIVLVNNSIDALMEKPDPQKEWIDISFNHYGNEVFIDVIDSGHGIPEEIVPHLFVPHFSTKEENGNGFGLYVAKEIIEGIGGTLTFIDDDSHTHFQISLPAEYSKDGIFIKEVANG